MSFEIITIDELLNRLNKYNHKEVHIHHTYQPDHADYTGSNGIALQQAMRNYHVNVRHFIDIAQHITILPDGLIVTGRAFNVTPASITGYNTGSFAVEMLGNFDIGHDVFGGKQRETALRIARYFINKGKYVRFHNENASKSCPGTSINKAVFMADARTVSKIGDVTVVARSYTIRPSTPIETKSNVKRLQECLNADGYRDHHGRRLVTDGVYGTHTESALLDVALRVGSKGQMVGFLQDLLSGRNGYPLPKYGSDGSFGGETHTALVRFQTDCKIHVDGIAGITSFIKLMGI